MLIKSLLTSVVIIAVFSSCSTNNGESKEEIRLSNDSTSDVIDPTDTSNVLRRSTNFAQLATYPNKVILTGMKDHRLIPIYRKNSTKAPDYSASRRSSYYYEEFGDEHQFFMPGIDLLLGYNLINIAHYNFKTGSTKLLFRNPVLVKSIYYPSFVQDSLDNKPVNRDYFLISAYNEDTNGDTLLTKKDLRRIFCFKAVAAEAVQLIPSDYSVVRSQYDSMNDVMYIFARHDANKNGQSENEEPLHVFWISLPNPAPAKRIY